MTMKLAFQGADDHSHCPGILSQAFMNCPVGTEFT